MTLQKSKDGIEKERSAKRTITLQMETPEGWNSEQRTRFHEHLAMNGIRCSNRLQFNAPDLEHYGIQKETTTQQVLRIPIPNGSDIEVQIRGRLTESERADMTEAFRQILDEPKGEYFCDDITEEWVQPRVRDGTDIFIKSDFEDLEENGQSVLMKRQTIMTAYSTTDRRDWVTVQVKRINTDGCIKMVIEASCKHTKSSVAGATDKLSCSTVEEYIGHISRVFTNSGYAYHCSNLTVDCVVVSDFSLSEVCDASFVKSLSSDDRGDSEE